MSDAVKRFSKLMEKSNKLFKKHSPAQNSSDLEKYVEATQYAIEASKISGLPSDLVAMGKEYANNCREITTSAAEKLRLEHVIKQLEGD